MAFENLMARINMLLNGMQHESEDSYGLLEELHLELNQLKATGQPLPDDLQKLERRLEEELAARVPVARTKEPIVANIKIDKEASPEGGRYVARIAGVEGEAELTFTRISDDVVRADHTEAPETMRGTGAAQALVAQLVADAREDGFAIVARCSYIASQCERHPEWSDVLRC